MQVKVLTPWRSEEARNDMLVAEEYPASWTDITWQADELIGVDKLNRLVAVGEGLSEAQVATIRADARFVVLSVQEEAEDAPPPELEPLETVKTELATLLSSDVARMVVEDTVPDTADALVEAVRATVLYDPWQMGSVYVAGDAPSIVYYEGNLYRCLQPHTATDPNWKPGVAFSLWTRFYEPSDDPWPWIQPQGAHDAYPLGARVLHDEATWVSLIADNVWEPGSVGAEVLWEREVGEPTTDAWSVGVAYTGDNTAGSGNGDMVTYNGRLYRCWQSHTSLAGWEPPNVPALWIDLGPV